MLNRWWLQGRGKVSVQLNAETVANTHWIRISHNNLAPPLAQLILLRILTVLQSERDNPLLDLARLDPSRLRQRVDFVKMSDHGDLILVESGKQAQSFVRTISDRGGGGEEVMEGRQKSVGGRGVGVDFGGFIGGRRRRSVDRPSLLERDAVDYDIVVSFGVERLDL